MFSNLYNTFLNCFKIPELKSRILFTFGLLAIAQVLGFIHVPGINGAVLSHHLAQAESSGGILGMYNTFAGGAFDRCAVDALSIMPYISATIILQLLTAVWPKLSKLAREEGGRTKIVQYGRYLTVLLCIGQGWLVNANGWWNQKYDGENLVMVDSYNHVWFVIQTVIILTAGTMLLMWLGEQITERGIGNGVSLIITANILSRMPAAIHAAKNMFFPDSGEPTHSVLGTGILLVILLVIVVGGVIAITQAQRKIPVQYASRMIGQKMYQGGTNYMPLRVNYAGVMPIIFASSILMFPSQILGWLANHVNTTFLRDNIIALATALNYGSWLYLTIYAVMILFFSYFWVATQFNEIQIADDLKKNGGYIPGVRPGTATSDYLHKAMSRITLAGAIFLTVIATLPIVLSKRLDIDQNVSQFFGGTSMLISVGVLLDTMRQVESHLMMRHYDGFLKKGKIRGRF
jgi:preprotein translocase subunit SecY